MASRLSQFHVCILSSVLVFATTGCQTAKKRQQSALSYIDNGQLEQAITVLDEGAAARGAEKEVIAIDRALATAMVGDVATSEASLHSVRQRLDFLRQKDVKEQTVAVLTDDKAVAWTGREFEQRMIDNMLILTSLLGNHQDAFAYAAQAMEKAAADRKEQSPTEHAASTIPVGHTSEIAPAPPDARLEANALTAYLHAAVHSENAMNVDVTERSLQQVSYWKRSASQPAPPIPIGTKTKRGHGALHVITFTGRVTDWQAEDAAPTTAALLIADQILSAVGNHTLPPTIAPVKIAQPVQRSSSTPWLTSATIDGNAEHAGLSSVLVDLNRSAWASYMNDRNQQIARAVVRRIVKKGAIYAAKDQMSVSNNTGLDLMLNIGGIAWEALEKPDTRHLSLLPERIEVLQMELPEGRHRLALSAVPLSGPQEGQSSAATVPVDIDNGRNTFVLCYRTGQRFTSIVGTTANE